MSEFEANQLDFIVKNSKYRVLVYDKNQTVKGSDITHDQFLTSIKESSVSTFIFRKNL